MKHFIIFNKYFQDKMAPKWSYLTYHFQIHWLTTLLIPTQDGIIEFCNVFLNGALPSLHGSPFLQDPELLLVEKTQFSGNLNHFAL